MIRLLLSASHLRLPLSERLTCSVDGHQPNFNILDIIHIEDEWISLGCSTDHINNKQTIHIRNSFRNLSKIIRFLKKQKIYYSVDSDLRNQRLFRSVWEKGK